MSLGNTFIVALPSNVPGPKSNTPGAYETTLAYPLDLPGIWEVGLIDITYPHTWLNLNNEIVVGISVAFTEIEIDEENQDIIGDTNSMDLVKALKNVGSYYRSERPINRYRDIHGTFRANYSKIRVNFRVRKTFGIIPAKYKLKELLEKLQTEIRSVGHGLQNTRVLYDRDTDRVTITGNTRKFMISSYTKNSLLPMLGFANQITTNKQEMEERENCYNEQGQFSCIPLTEYQEVYLHSPGFTLVDYIIIERDATVEANLPPILGRINEIFVYTDIIETVLVGNSQVPMLGYFPIQSKWGDEAYWNFNPPYYVRVKDNNIRTIAIRLCDKTGDTINFESGDVICRINFRRKGLLSGFL